MMALVNERQDNVMPGRKAREAIIRTDRILIHPLFIPYFHRSPRVEPRERKAQRDTRVMLRTLPRRKMATKAGNSLGVAETSGYLRD
jgi:hypothetical protein